MLLIFSGEEHKEKCLCREENCLCNPKFCKKEGNLTTKQSEEGRRFIN